MRAVLALDTATEACSAALLRGDELIGRFSEGGLSHARRILGMVDEVLEEAGMTLSMLDGIAASIGPGAFTGVRISVAVAQGLAFGADLPVVAVTTLEALAWKVLSAGAPGAGASAVGVPRVGVAGVGAPRAGALAGALACLDARMGEVYWGCYAPDAERGLVAVGAARVGPPGSVALPAGAANGAPGASGVYRGIGRGFAAYPALSALPRLQVDPSDSRALPDAREFARLGALRLGLGEGLDPADLMPLYLRDKVALTEAERAAK